MGFQQLLDVATDVLIDGRQLAREFRDLHVLGLGDQEAHTVAARRHRTDKAFALLRRCQACLETLAAYRRDPRGQSVRRRLQRCLRSAQRLNRESPIPRALDTVSIPVREFKNFLRGGQEHMYFLALHPFPSAFDFFCTTYVEAPRGYRQELHLHQRSEEVTLVLHGEADCVWLTPGPRRWVDAGRRTARAGQAFRIPPRVVHTIENPTQANRNLTVKLTMFIDDRVGESEPKFGHETTVVAPVTVDLGHEQSSLCGHRVLFQHGFRGLTFQYCIHVVEPGKSLIVPRGNHFALLFAGNLIVRPEHRFVQSSSVLHLRGEVELKLTNPGSDEAKLFSIQGLDSRDFVKNPHRYTPYPQWCLRPLRHHCWECAELLCRGDMRVHRGIPS